MIETLPSGTILHERYRIERVLGSGGFGNVYLVMDLKTNQQYAVKEYFVTGTMGQEQLKHEVNVLSQLHHPNLPTFHGAFNERDRYYVVLNYIEGTDLTDIIRRIDRGGEIVSTLQIVSWVLSICDAVLFLHGQGPPVIHRDIKPDNIRIMSNGTAILVDLGNAKAAVEGVRTHMFIRNQGTPGYAPPEQYPGGNGTDVRSDIYALGGTLYFALTTHEPPSVSARNEAHQQGKPDLLSLHERLAANPESRQDPRQFRAGVLNPVKPPARHSRHLARLGTLPPEIVNELNRIIQHAMAMKPEDRYKSAVYLAHDLKGVITTLTTPPPTSPSSTPPTHCPRCNTALSSHAVFCSGCGIPLTRMLLANTPANLSNEPLQNRPGQTGRPSIAGSATPPRFVAGTWNSAQMPESGPASVYISQGRLNVPSSSSFYTDPRVIIGIAILAALLILLGLFLLAPH